MAALRYVALGDSYTIGTGVVEAERWPNQLVERLGGDPARGGTGPLTLVGNLAVNGFTSRDVIERELPSLAALEPELVTLLVGVNDAVQGVGEATYRENINTILDDLLGRVGSGRIVIVTTPDYTVTPAGGDYGDPAQRAAGIREFNAVMAELARARSIALVDVHPISLAAATDRSLVAGDGLHPSGAQYARWVDEIASVVEGLLAR